MKKTFIIIICLLLTTCMVSCTENHPTGGVRPTTEFTVNSVVQDNAVFQKESNVVIRGTGENGVNIIVDLIDENNKVDESYSTQIQENSWNITFKAPKASFDEYSIAIYDEYSTFKKEYKHIRFGEVIMLMGDPFSNNLVEEELDLEDLSYYVVSDEGAKWIDFENDEFTIDNYSYKLAKKLSKDEECPVGVIINQVNGYLYEWLNLENIEQVSPIKNYLVENNLYTDAPTKKGDTGYLEMTRSKYVSDLSIAYIIWNHGFNEINSFTDKIYTNVYFQMLMCLMDSLNNFYRQSKIAILEIGSYDKLNVVTLRRIQKYVSNYYTEAYLIPTFDLNNDVKELVKRTVNILDKKALVSQYSNLYVDIDEQQQIIKSIKIEINNTDLLIVKDEDNVINHFNVYYNDPEKGKVKLDINPIIENNVIIIDLTYQEETEDKEDKNEIIKFYDKNLISIEYGMSNDLSDINLFNEDELPVLPFEILFD